jgi:oligoendopeptidase F
MAPKILTRSEIPESDTWDLSHLFQTEEAYREAFAQLRDLYPKTAEYKTRLGESVKTLFACLEFQKSLDQIAERLGHYASLKNAEESSNNDNLSRQAELTNLLTKVGEVASFINPEIQQIADETFQRFLDDPILVPWKIALIKLRRYKPHTLSEREERLLTLGAPVIRGHSDTFSQLTNVDMKFGSLNVEGQELELSQSSYFSFLNNRDRDLRRKAFHQFYAEFDDHKYSLASALSALRENTGDAGYRTGIIVDS